jgi:phage FluMu protein Com
VDLRDPITRRCHKCKSILLKHEPGAFAEGRKVEIKCKCNAMNYIAVYEAERTPNMSEGRTKAGKTMTGFSDRSTSHAEGTAGEARQAHC